jgi:hypothetical protein
MIHVWVIFNGVIQLIFAEPVIHSYFLAENKTKWNTFILNEFVRLTKQKDLH